MNSRMSLNRENSPISARTIESKALAAEISIADKIPNSNAALEAAIRSAELYMQALKLTASSSERKRLDQKTKVLLSKAELIKAAQDGKSKSVSQNSMQSLSKSVESTYPQSTRNLTTRESIILLEGSKLNGAVFKPWTVAPKVADFELGDPGEELYLDLPHLPLSPAQQKFFAGWKRPSEALSMVKLEKDGVDLIEDPTMDKKDGKIDLVQDMTSDCSVVASLCAGTARAERGHHRILGSILHPSSSSSTPLLSPSGKYILRLYFNGTYRSVPIDDLLPTSSSARMLHVIDRKQPSLLWPALVEKAYLKVRGGYDFPGSNSGTDLAVLTGWVPQQVFLHDEEDVVDREALWGELFEAFERGNMLLTIGTGKLPRREQKVTGLAAEHDYAVLELVESWKKSEIGGEGEKIKVREMLIKNPWSDGDVWIGAAKRRPNPSQGSDSKDQAKDGQDRTKLPSDDSMDLNDSVERMMPGTFWMDFNSVFHYFENMYINWNPGIFSHRQDIHFSWNVPETPFVSNVFVDNPQFAVQPASYGELWILLNRHFRTGDYTNANSGKNGYISLYLFDSDGTKVLSSEGVATRGPFVDSPNTLLRFQAKARKSYTAVVVSQDLPAGKHNFTLSVFAKSPVILEEPQLRYREHASLTAAWTRNTAGGNSDSIRYLCNPQFNFAVTSDNTKTALMLRITSDSTSNPDEINTHVKLLVLANPSSRRITRLRPRDIVATSSDYRRGSAVVETTLSRGTYAIICSTFEEHQLAKFQLDLYTSSANPTTLKPIPPESSGRHSILTAPVMLSNTTTRAITPLHIPHTTRAIFIARPHSDQTPASNFLYKLSLQQGRGPYAQTLATSADDAAEFTHASRGLRIEDLDLSPAMARAENGGLWLALERPRTQTLADDETVGLPPALEVEILAHEKMEVGQWEAVDEC